MTLSQRQHDILGALQTSRDGQLAVEALASRFAVSAQTIRKDLNTLCERGLARRLHGGIGLPPESRNVSFESRRVMNAGVKDALARRTAEMIPEGASVALGIGTTVELVARHLAGRRELRVMTNNLAVAGALCDSPWIEVYLAEGRLRHEDRDVVGDSVTRFFEQFHVDFGIVGSGGLDPEQGLLDFDPEEAKVSRSILTHARCALLVADASKWNRPAMVRVAPWHEVDRMITDELAPARAAALRAARVEPVLLEDPT